MGNEQGAINTAENFLQYDAFVNKTTEWFKVRADRYHWYYNISRTALVLLSISLPVLSKGVGLFGGIGESLVPYIALIIAVLGSLDGLFKPGDNWRHFRSYQLALARFRRISDSERKNLDLLESTEEREREGLKLYRGFVLEIEQLLEEESKKFFEHQIQQLKKV